MTDETRVLTDTLTTMLVRRFRAAVYREIESDVGVEVRDGTFPVLTGLLEGPATATTLGLRGGTDRTTTSRQVSALVRAGLVDRSTDPSDRRNERLALTPAGRTVAEALRSNAEALVEGATARWTDAERTALATLLPRLVEAIAPPPRRDP
uniref:Winged helix-turn-helix transcriptional regulator n=1 Tax=Neobacillus citreus TaxID=2833578 RepID=A0A942T6F3_9BACI